LGLRIKIIALLGKGGGEHRKGGEGKKNTFHWVNLKQKTLAKRGKKQTQGTKGRGGAPPLGVTRVVTLFKDAQQQKREKMKREKPVQEKYF